MKFLRIEKSPWLMDFENNNPMPIPPYDAIEQMVNQIDREYLKLLSDNNLNPEWYEPTIETDYETGKITITATQIIRFTSR